METIKSRQEFEQVFSRGRRYNARLVRITVLKGDEGGPGKVAFVAAKRLGHAPLRNRSKRVLREAARMCDMPRKGTHVILFATRETAAAHPRQVADSLQSLLRKAGI